MLEKYIKKNNLLMVMILCFASYFAAYDSPANNYSSDPNGSLLVSQAILEHGTIKLDQYSEVFPSYTYQITEINSHYYYYYPLGTSILSIPFVWMANLIGWDMSEPANASQAQLQNLISAITVAISCLLTFLISRCFVNYSLSLLISAAFVFGSSILSTMGTALWSHDFTIAINLLILLILTAARQDRINSFNPFILGALLFLTNLSRPTSVIFTLLVMVYVYWGENRKIFFRLVLSYVIILGVFVLFSWTEYGTALPPYYLLGTRNNLRLLKPIYGNLFSPARGLIVYQPFLIVIFLGMVATVKKLWIEPFFWLGLYWFILHLFLISRWPMWWGGHSFGSRLFLDALPAALLLTLMVFQKIHLFGSKRQKRALIAGFAGLTIVAIFINTFQGMYNPNTLLWNAVSDINNNPRYLFSWKFPQFMANPKMLQNLQFDRSLIGLKPYRLGDEILPKGTEQKALFVGWHKSDPEEGCMWSDLRSAEIIFRIKPEQYLGSKELAMEVISGTSTTQNVEVFVNDTQVGEILAHADTSNSIYTFPVSKEALGIKNEISSMPLPVVIKLFIPNTQPIQSNSPQLMSLCKIKIYPKN